MLLPQALFQTLEISTTHADNSFVKWQKQFNNPLFLWLLQL